MLTHTAQVRGRRIAWDRREVVQHGLNADAVVLDLDEEWRECDRIQAVLVGADGPIRILVEGGRFNLPSALMEAPGAIRMCLMGHVGEAVRIVTAKEAAPLTVVESGETAGVDPAPEQPDLWARLIEEVRKATKGASAAAQSAAKAESDLRAAAERGDFDGRDGDDGVSPTAKVEQTPTGATLTVVDGSGTTTAQLSNGKDGVRPKAGAGISVAEDGTTAVDLEGLRGMLTATNIRQSIPPEGVQGGVGYVVTPLAVIVTPLSNVSVPVPQIETATELPFAIIKTGYAIPKAQKSVRLAQIHGEGWYFITADYGLDGTVTLNVLAPKTKAGQTLTIKSSDFEQLVVPLIGGVARDREPVDRLGEAQQP